MTRYAARLLIVIVPLLVWISAGVSQVAAVGTTPILLVVNDSASNQYGNYLGEILRAEGLNSFTVAQLSTVNAAALDAAELVVLAETPLSASQVTLFTNYVNGGGRLIAMRPAAQLASLFDLSAAGSALTDPYLRIDAAQPAGQGLARRHPADPRQRRPLLPERRHDHRRALQQRFDRYRPSRRHPRQHRARRGVDATTWRATWL